MHRIVLFGLFSAAICTNRVLGIDGITFAGPLTINNVPRPPVTVHSGDFNKDGKIDLVASNGTGIVTVFFQDPLNREKWTSVPVRVGSSCSFTRGVDFDGDGIDDLAVADVASTVYYVRSNGDGTFEKPVSVSQARSSRWIATADWNMDGRIDFATTSTNTSMLTIFVNELSPEGLVAFRLTQNTASGREHTLEALDFNGDGIMDLSLGTGLPGIQLHKGVGDGTLKYTPPNVTALSCVEYISIGDFNKDGKDDLTATCIDDGTAYVAIANPAGDGKYTRTLAAPFAAGTEASAVGDLNRDGNPDLALVSAGSGQLRVYPGLGDGKFGTPFEFGPTGAGPLFLIVEDLDRDGMPDVVSADTGGTTLTVFFGKEGERFLQSADSITGFVAARGFGVDDFDGDGAPDVFLTATSQAKAFIYLKPGGSSPTKPSLTVDLDERYRYSTLTVADLNNDGIPDLAGTNLTLDSIIITLLDAEGKAHDEVAMLAGDAPQDLEVGYIDPGPTLDLAVPVQNANQVSIFLGHGDGKFDEMKAVPSIEKPKRVALGDLNNDRRTDLAVIQPKMAAVQLQNEDGTFAPPVMVLSDAARNFTEVAIADLNGDSFNDIVMSESRTLSVLVFPGMGDGTFGEFIPIKIDVPPFSLHLTDIDGDGLLDVSASSSAGQAVAISLNLGAGAFSPVSLYRVGTGVSAHRVMDMNQDGVPDILAFGSTSLTLRLGSRQGQPPEPLFRRGDADGSGKVELTDAVSTLNWLFLQSAPLGCEDGADTNDDGKIDLTDPVSTLNWLFLEGPEPSAPGPNACGVDPNPDELKRCRAKC